jgi:hypothetical protein
MRLRMSLFRRLFLIFSLAIAIPLVLSAQVENVPVDHPIYPFLKRMELKGIIGRYFDVVLPLSRKDVAKYLVVTAQHEDQLSSAERDALHEYLAEFQYDISKSTDGFEQLFNFSDQSVGDAFMSIFNEKEKYLYVYADTNLSIFVNGLLTVDGRKSVGDALGNQHAEFIQAGAGARGTLYDHWGYFIQETNAQFWGDRAVLDRDPIINQSFSLGTTDSRNFDLGEGYVRYDGGLVSVELGQERVLWGTGYGNEQLILSDNPREFAFIRLDAQWRSFKYTYLQGNLLGSGPNYLAFEPAGAPADTFQEDVIADKYIVAHRFGFSFPGALDFGFQEAEIYANRSLDLAYLNPLILIESVSRSREERDNDTWTFDMQLHFVRNFEVQGSMDLDDINFAKLGDNNVQNKYAEQIGVMSIDPAGIKNTTLSVQYTRIEPYTFTHTTREGNYTSFGRILGDSIGPNSDSKYIRLDNMWTYKFSTSFSYDWVRHGADIFKNGILVENVGGNVNYPNDPSVDSQQKDFLGGDLIRVNTFLASATYELFRKFYLDAHYQHQVIVNTLSNTTSSNDDFGADIRLEF